MKHRDGSARLHAALAEARVVVSRLREALRVIEQDLASQRQQLEDAERRGRLAAGIPDAETVAIAERFAARHRAWVGLLERKAGLQRDEIALAEKDLADLADQGEAVGTGTEATPEPPGAGASEDPLLRHRLDRAAHEAAAEAQLAFLKKKMGKDPK
jgi:fumarate hydratase class II